MNWKIFKPNMSDMTDTLGPNCMLKWILSKEQVHLLRNATLCIFAFILQDAFCRQAKHVYVYIYLRQIDEVQCKWQNFLIIFCMTVIFDLTFSSPITTKLPYGNSFNWDEKPNSAYHPDPSCLTLRQHFNKC